MKIQSKALLVLLALFTTTISYAQIDSLIPPSHNNLGAKVLFTNYGIPNGVDSLRITNGLEVLYIRNVTPYINFALPIRAGVAHLPERVNNENYLGADGLLQVNFVPNDRKVVPYIFAGGGVMLENMDTTNFQLPAGLGFNFKVGDNSFLNLQGEYRYSLSEQRSNIQAGIGYIYRFGKSKVDTDNDGVPDEEDQCPDAIGSVELAGCPDGDGDGIADDVDVCPTEAGLEALGGCPDTDGDGLADRVDECPNEVGSKTANGCPDADGDGIADSEDQCPDAVGNLRGCPDRDKDGIADKDDDCPDDAGELETNGCPNADTDGDGVNDLDDKCPTQAGTVAAMGCPDIDGDGFGDDDDKCPDLAGPFDGCPDSDGDGIDDSSDRCPRQAGSSSNGGCPETRVQTGTVTGTVTKVETDIASSDLDVLRYVMQNIQFESGGARVRTHLKPLLADVAEIMRRYPDYNLRISGHTDNVGNPDSNLELSRKRAASCFKHVVRNGISPSRITYEGYGDTRPVADNSSSSGRKQNRRVEFELYRRY